MISATIFLSTPSTDAGPSFNIYSNTDGYVNAFATGISKSTLLSGYFTSAIPDNTTIVKLESLGPTCTNYVNIIMPTTSTTTTASCNVNIKSVVTTDPTNIPANNGTATILFEGGTAPFTYKLNSVMKGSASSPLVINELSATTSYTVEIIDSNLCTDNTQFTLGESTFYFDADYIMLTYEFTDGVDLDTKTLLSKYTTSTGSVVSPVPGQTTPADYLGFAVNGNSVTDFPESVPVPILTWGGDNKGTGFESVLINVKQFRLNYPTAISFVIDARCLWFRPNEKGINPVIIAAKLWKGGEPVQNGCDGFCWVNPNPTDTYDIDSVGVTITSTDRTCGERAATLTYNLQTKVGVLNNDDEVTENIC
jgi:hypothetical protein